jgi:hypothetical protein
MLSYFDDSLYGRTLQKLVRALDRDWQGLVYDELIKKKLTILETV